MNTIFFVGSYTETITPDFGGHGDGIYTMSLDTKKGKIKHLHTFKTTNPSYLAISDNQKYLYSVTEVVSQKNPKIQAFAVQADYSLQLLNEVEISSSLPCHISYFEQKVVVSCYGSGDVLLFSTTDFGQLLNGPEVINHSGSSLNLDRQESAHPHQAVFSKKHNKIYVPDLGLDAVKVYKVENNKLQEAVAESIEITAGFGPRHLVFNKSEDLGYVINELTGQLSILKSTAGVFKQIEVCKSLPDSFKEQPSASAIRLHPDGEFLYVANRKWDGITVFKVHKETLQRKDFKMMKANTIRDFAISPDGDWLIAALQDSDLLKVFQINGNGTLLEKKSTKTIGSPAAVLFLNH